MLGGRLDHPFCTSASELISETLLPITRPRCVDMKTVNPPSWDATTAHLGKSALIPKLNEPTVFESNMMRLTLNAKSAAPVYVTHYLQTSFVKAQIQVLAKDAVNQSSINQEDVKGLIVRLPPMPLQQKFATLVERMERLRAVQREALRQAEHLFASLLDRAFRG